MSKKKYRPITIHLDPSDLDDKKILDWLDKNRSKKENYSTHIRKALEEYILRQSLIQSDRT